MAWRHDGGKEWRFDGVDDGVAKAVVLGDSFAEAAGSVQDAGEGIGRAVR